MAIKNGGRTALKDLVAKATADYNRMVTVKKHRIDGGKKALIYNLFFSFIRSQPYDILDLTMKKTKASSTKGIS